MGDNIAEEKVARAPWLGVRVNERFSCKGLLNFGRDADRSSDEPDRLVLVLSEAAVCDDVADNMFDPHRGVINQRFKLLARQMRGGC